MTSCVPTSAHTTFSEYIKSLSGVSNNKTSAPMGLDDVHTNAAYQNFSCDGND